MRIRILAAGKPSLAYAKSGVDEYLKRLGRYGSHELEFLKAGDSSSVSAALLERSAGTFRIALDERGDSLVTRAWADHFAALEMRGDIKALCFLIGASDGHTPELRKRCDAVWSLSSLTMQHELALVVLLEQLYRVATLRRGEPYHR
ncbi:MAG: 23S rRNA (pseudouridine(1915)-N(3))-methyltransferase RlmH [Verrucomicrobia bacterium]|nr:MAG: 23S rRNA (pseudouridine(1915)-N(3))-methyltransferase RlmH [Verrucomicrobiota bacterium]TAE88180.1 MAG: 23S rRNA (pseudouridine(1915)-N(3))-methyltransferase RlmH [Verrucomicrobiota bacterium]TAF26064.1 MAG: 23S rRNA (pseudouridine(1915)-N(3))-methyltransferase RlmH [Verrucomicrobiota bacterium]TAF41011.1 MAG: 23S rRNA (pseudouridine(1915)-N(3))-methyltransferase RlmH [Verrucomicrobiota bacterium]